MVIGDYAIGGAIGASFCIDALQTEDIDAFVTFPVAVSGLVSLTPIYQALIAQGGIEEREYIRFGEWPVQILIDANSLIAEAIREAQLVQFKDVFTRVFRAEIDEAKTALNRRVKESLRKDLRAKSWEDKVASIARMNTVAKIAQEGMRKALAETAKQTEGI